MSCCIPEGVADEAACVLALLQGYTSPKVLYRADGQRELWAIARQVYTVGVACIELRDGGIAHRYCYETGPEAARALNEYLDPTQPPPGNWIKHKGWHNGKHADDLNPNWSRK